MSINFNRRHRLLFALCFMLCLFMLSPPLALAQGGTTTAQVEFVPGEGPTVPVNPDDPNVPENNGEEQDGSFVIVKVSDFDFDSVKIAPGNQSYGITTDKPNIQVADLRGTGAGWRVTASLSRFSSGGAPSLPGASIVFVSGRPNSISVSPAPTQSERIELTSDDEPLTIINAQEGAGTGLWIMRWYPESGPLAYVTLDVPSGSATLGRHTATINWVLENTPSATPPEPDTFSAPSAV